MKKLFIILILLAPVVLANAQESKSRKEKRAEKEELKKEEIKQLIDNRSFVFNASHALPMGGSSINLNYYYNVTLEGENVESYLPFYGVAYTAEYGSRNSPLSFNGTVEDYSVEKDKNGYQIQFDVKNGNDYLNYRFNISELGYASLSITSTNRQFISFIGTVESVEEDI
jgi:hypothetical protein